MIQADYSLLAKDKRKGTSQLQAVGAAEIRGGSAKHLLVGVAARKADGHSPDTEAYPSADL